MMTTSASASIAGDSVVGCSPGYSVVVVSNGPTPSNSLFGFSVVISGGIKGGFVGGPTDGNPGKPGKSGNPGTPPGPPSILGGGKPIPLVKSSAGLSISLSGEPGFTPMPVGDIPISISLSSGGSVAGDTNSLSNPGPLGLMAPSGS